MKNLPEIRVSPLFCSSTNVTWCSVFVDDVEYISSPRTTTKTTPPSRSKRKHKVVAREMSSEANHKGDTKICFPKFRFTTVYPTSLLRNSLGVSLFQLDPLSWVSFNNFPDSTILIHSTKGARSRPHKLATTTTTLGASQRCLAV